MQSREKIDGGLRMEAVSALLRRIQLDYGVYIGSKSIHKLAFDCFFALVEEFQNWLEQE